jgi:hypothetical protein
VRDRRDKAVKENIEKTFGKNGAESFEWLVDSAKMDDKFKSSPEIRKIYDWFSALDPDTQAQSIRLMADFEGSISEKWKALFEQYGAQRS